MQIQFWGITQKSHYFHQRHASKLDPKSNSTFTNLITDSPYKLGIKEKGEKTHISKHFHQSYWGKVCINILAWSTMIININDTLAPKECSFPYRQMCSQCQRISVLHESITVLGVSFVIFASYSFISGNNLFISQFTSHLSASLEDSGPSFSAILILLSSAAF